jgi:hypothetical protein
MTLDVANRLDEEVDLLGDEVAGRAFAIAWVVPRAGDGPFDDAELARTT